MYTCINTFETTKKLLSGLIYNIALLFTGCPHVAFGFSFAWNYVGTSLLLPPFPPFLPPSMGWSGLFLKPSMTWGVLFDTFPPFFSKSVTAVSPSCLVQSVVAFLVVRGQGLVDRVTWNSRKLYSRIWICCQSYRLAVLDYQLDVVRVHGLVSTPAPSSVQNESRTNAPSLFLVRNTDNIKFP